MHDERSYKIVMIGESGVGKSNILSQFSFREFTHDCMPTIGIDFKCKKFLVPINDKETIPTTLKIFDTSGQHRFQSITEHYQSSNADGMIVVFDVTNLSTLRRAENLIERAREISPLGENLPILLVGNKTDLTDKRCITPKEEEETVHRLDIEPCFDISAKTEPDECDAVFQKITLLIHENRLLHVETKNSHSDSTQDEPQKRAIQQRFTLLSRVLDTLLLCSCKHSQ